VRSTRSAVFIGQPASLAVASRGSRFACQPATLAGTQGKGSGAITKVPSALMSFDSFHLPPVNTGCDHRLLLVLRTSVARSSGQA
jgi:hypothetical protein